MAGAWALISAKQCVSVSDCVVFVREMGRSVGWLSGAGFIFVTWCGIGAVITWDGVGGLAVFAPIFLFLVCLGLCRWVQCNKWPICMMWRWWPANIVLCLMGE